MRYATIRWFDSMTGEGVVRFDDDSCEPIHFTQFYTPTDRNFHFPSPYMQQQLERLLAKGTEVIKLENGNYILDL